MKRASPALSLKPLPSALPARGEGCCAHGPGASTGIRPGAGRAAPCCQAQPFLHFCLSSASSLSWISVCSPYALCPAMGTRRHLHFHVAVTGKGRPCQQPVSQRVAKRPVLHSETGRIAARNGPYCSAERAVRHCHMRILAAGGSGLLPWLWLRIGRHWQDADIHNHFLNTSPSLT